MLLTSSASYFASIYNANLVCDLYCRRYRRNILSKSIVGYSMLLKVGNKTDNRGEQRQVIAPQESAQRQQTVRMMHSKVSHILAIEGKNLLQVAALCAGLWDEVVGILLMFLEVALRSARYQCRHLAAIVTQACECCNFTCSKLLYVAYQLLNLLFRTVLVVGRQSITSVCRKCATRSYAAVEDKSLQMIASAANRTVLADVFVSNCAVHPFLA